MFVIDRLETRIGVNEGDACASSLAFADVARDGRCYVAAAEVLEECHATVIVNGREHLRLACTPTDLAQLIVGRLCTEGVLETADDLVSLDEDVTEGAPRVSVVLRNRRAGLLGSDIEAPILGATGDFSRFSASVRALAPLEARPWSIEEAFSLCDQFARDTPLHRSTSGTHSCRLSIGGRTVYVSEDIGRHNAMDKVVGHLLLSGIDPARAMVFSSGRVPADMAAKAIRGRIPVLVTKAAPTDEAVRLARWAHLTLVCKAARERLRVFSGADLAY